MDGDCVTLWNYLNYTFVKDIFEDCISLWNFENQASMDAERYFKKIEDFCILIAFEWRLCSIVKFFKSFVKGAFLKIVCHYEIMKF